LKIASIPKHKFDALKKRYDNLKAKHRKLLEENRKLYYLVQAENKKESKWNQFINLIRDEVSSE